MYDLQFAIYAASEGGSPLAGPITLGPVEVSRGRFTVLLDFGVSVFTGEARWLEIGVRPGGGVEFTTLRPRQPVTPVPYAFYAPAAGAAGIAMTASNLLGTVGPHQLVGAYTNAVTFSHPANVLVGSFTGEGSGLTRLNAAHLTSGTLADERLSANVALRDAANTFTGLNLFHPAGGAPFAVGTTAKVEQLNADLLDGQDSSAFWTTTGNAGAAAGAHFLGTTDEQSLELRVNNGSALRLQPHASSPSLIGGFGDNLIAQTAAGAVIGGGGRAGAANAVWAPYATLGGGAQNLVEEQASHAVLGGGERNTIRTHSQHAVLAGGLSNRVSGEFAAVGGGEDNEAAGHHSVVPGGQGNLAPGRAESGRRPECPRRT